MSETIYSDFITAEFIKECAKIGSVHITTCQVIIESDDGAINLQNLPIPARCSIESVNAMRLGKDVYDRERIRASVTFRFPFPSTSVIRSASQDEKLASLLDDDFDEAMRLQEELN